VKCWWSERTPLHWVSVSNCSRSTAHSAYLGSTTKSYEENRHACPRRYSSRSAAATLFLPKPTSTLKAATSFRCLLHRGLSDMNSPVGDTGAQPSAAISLHQDVLTTARDACGKPTRWMDSERNVGHDSNSTSYVQCLRMRQTKPISTSVPHAQATFS
jgi:hypothetical protein